MPRANRRDSERGASLVEFAIVTPLLLLLILGLVEFGLLFKDNLSIASSSREGARVGAAVGQDPEADLFILQNVGTALTGAIPAGALVKVRIYDPDVYNPTIEAGPDGQVYTPAATACGWNPCPDLSINPGYVSGWPPANRSITAGSLDKLAVDVVIDHDWVTGFVPGLTGTKRITETTIMNLEPQIFS